MKGASRCSKPVRGPYVNDSQSTPAASSAFIHHRMLLYVSTSSRSVATNHVASYRNVLKMTNRARAYPALDGVRSQLWNQVLAPTSGIQGLGEADTS